MMATKMYIGVHYLPPYSLPEFYGALLYCDRITFGKLVTVFVMQ